MSDVPDDEAIVWRDGIGHLARTVREHEAGDLEWSPELVLERLRDGFANGYSLLAIRSAAGARRTSPALVLRPR